MTPGKTPGFIRNIINPSDTGEPLTPMGPTGNSPPAVPIPVLR